MEPIPISVLTGFLGSGKTTLLNRLLTRQDLRDTAVIVNEFGEVAIDHLLVERSTDGIIELADGCICCSIRGELVDTLTELLERMDRGDLRSVRRIIIETTGLADPAPILHALMAHPLLVRRLRLDGILTTVDAVNGDVTLDRHEPAVRQVAMADRIIVTKRDLPEAGDGFSRLVARLAALNPTAPVFDVRDVTQSEDNLFGSGLQDAGAENWLRAERIVEPHRHHDDSNRQHPHDRRIRSFCLIHEEPIASGALDGFLDLLRAYHGEKLLRMKGIVRTVEDPERPTAIHAVQSLLHPAAQLPQWPSADRRSRLVLITIDLPEDQVRRLFDAFIGRPSIDAPDRAALENNPLAVPGFGL